MFRMEGLSKMRVGTFTKLQKKRLEKQRSRKEGPLRAMLVDFGLIVGSCWGPKGDKIASKEGLFCWSKKGPTNNTRKSSPKGLYDFWPSLLQPQKVLWGVGGKNNNNP